MFEKSQAMSDPQGSPKAVSKAFPPPRVFLKPLPKPRTTAPTSSVLIDPTLRLQRDAQKGPDSVEKGRMTLSDLTGTSMRRLESPFTPLHGLPTFDLPHHIPASNTLTNMALNHELLVPIHKDTTGVSTIHAFGEALLRLSAQWQAAGLVPNVSSPLPERPVGMFREWAELFNEYPGYLELAPYAIQQAYRSLTPDRLARLPSMKDILVSGLPKELPKPIGGKRSRENTPNLTNNDGDDHSICPTLPRKVLKTTITKAPLEGPKSRGLKKVSSQTSLSTPESKKENLAPGVKPHRFSAGHLRALRGIEHMRDGDLPKHALTAADHEFRSHCTPAQVNITLCDFPMSVEEIVTYFPLHTIWRAISKRLQSHGWTAKKITEFVVWVRKLDNEKSVSRTVIQHQFGKGQTWLSEQSSHTISANPSNMDPASGLRGGASSLKDYYLVDLAEGVKRHPDGPGAQMLTLAIQHALAMGNDKVKLSELHKYATDNNLAVLFPFAGVHTEDRTALQRLGGQAEQYYKDKFGRPPL